MIDSINLSVDMSPQINLEALITTLFNFQAETVKILGREALMDNIINLDASCE